MRQELIRRSLWISTLKDFELQAMGAGTSAIDTGDGMAEPLNRRVILRGYGYKTEKVASTE